MARITDYKKLDRLKKSTMKLVSKKGFGGASAVSIAADAKVATGYFYLHYNGKHELVNSLLLDIYQGVADKLNELINQGSSFNELVDNLIVYLFDLANKEPLKMKFFHAISNDDRFKMDKSIRASIFHLIDSVMEIGTNENLLDKKLTPEDLFLLVVINPIHFINQRFKHVSARYKFTNDDIEHVIYLIKKVLK